MIDLILPSLGTIGTVIFVSAYIPQIIHLIKVKDATGISIVSWSVWLFGAILLLIYVISLADFVFILLTVLETIALFIVIFLTIKYKKRKEDRLNVKL